MSFVLLYEVTALDSRNAARRAEVRHAAPEPSRDISLPFTATAYCKGTTTASGVNVRTGIAAADPDILPVGSVIHVEKLGDKYNGIYTVMDTGPKVQGRHIDVYMWSCNEALQFGRRRTQVTVLRLGWNPKATTPSAPDGLRQDAIRNPLPSRPITATTPISLPR